jgi:hypothetical protein
MDRCGMSGGLGKFAANRGIIFAAANLAFLLALAFAAAVGGGENTRILYLLLLFALCSSSILYMDGLNGRYTILVVLLTLFFVYYGALDLLSAYTGEMYTPASGALDRAEIAILIGVGGLILGYRTAVGFAGHGKKEIAVKDWSPRAIVIVGMLAWLCGLAATAYWQLVIERVAGRSDLSFSALTGVALVVGRQLQPMGVALLAYGLVVSRSRALLMLMIGVLSIEFVFGFVADSKELSIRGVLIVILAKILIDAKIPTRWLLSMAAVSLLAFPVFQAYRFEVLQEREVDRISALQNIGKSLLTAINSSKLDKSRDASVKSTSQFGNAGALGRVSLKATMEVIVRKTGNGVKFQDGHTIGLLVTGLIPRFIYSNKPDSSVGQLFNRQFHLSEDPDTFISATHLGELYWNFGWPGILIGMPLIGFLLGSVGSRFALRGHPTVTRFLVLVVTIYFICLRFEGGIALQYTLWLRSLMLVGVGHLIFAGTSKAARSGNNNGEQIARGAEHTTAPLYPNLIR